MMGSVGQFSWPGASGTDWWADPKEELAVVYLSAAPGPIRWHYRQKINALVYRRSWNSPRPHCINRG
jgi:CubicO group peptidase (beta-lactamase class C family)